MDKLYKIKPLVWEVNAELGWLSFQLEASSPCGEFSITEVHLNKGIFYVGLPDDVRGREFKTLEEAKAFADAYNADLMREGLEEVPND